MPRTWPDDGETKLLLLAHQDDEIAFAPLLSRFKAQGQPVRVVYLTDGATGRVSSERRSTESIQALASLGVTSDEVSFLGNKLSVPNGSLFRRFSTVYSALEAECSSNGTVGEIYTLAWEGGNMDHDAAYVIAVALAIAHDRVNSAWQLPFYRAIDHGPPMFSLFAPLLANGPVSRLKLTRHESWLRAALMRFYPSQWRTFAGLGPMILWHALTSPVLKLQPILPHRPWERPTAGPLLYERRYAVSFAEFSKYATTFFHDRGIIPAAESA